MAPGPAAQASVSYSTLSGVSSELPVVTVSAAASGPAVAVGANMHGDEVTGVGVIHALVPWLRDHLDRGVVHLYPSLNPRGLEALSRRIPGDDLDPNRAYPGSPGGSPAQRQAWRIWQDLQRRDVQLYLDLHTDAPVAIPYAIVDRVIKGKRRADLAGRCLALAAASGLTVLREYPAERYLRFDLQRSLPGALVNQRGMAALTLEVGPRRCIDPRAVADCLVATQGVLTAMGLCDAPARPHSTRVTGGPWRREGGPRTTRSGVLAPLLAPGAAFSRGQVLAEVRALDGRLREQITARFDGFVVAWPERGTVSVGATSATLALLDSAEV